MNQGIVMSEISSKNFKEMLSKIEQKEKDIKFYYENESKIFSDIIFLGYRVITTNTVDNLHLQE
jgi:hypothetical protein